MARPTAAARRYAEAAFELATRDDALDALGGRARPRRRLVGRRRGRSASWTTPAIPLARAPGRRGPAARGPGRRRRPEPGPAPRPARPVRDPPGRRRGVQPPPQPPARRSSRPSSPAPLPLTADETAAIRARVEAMAGTTVELRTEVDPALIGGLTVRVGDRLLDAASAAASSGCATQLTRGRPLAHRPRLGGAPAGRTRPKRRTDGHPVRRDHQHHQVGDRHVRRARRRPAASGPSSRSATASPRSTAWTAPSRPSCSSSPAG